MIEFPALNILLAEDSVDHAELIIDTLDEFNAENCITHVMNGEEVVDRLENIVAGTGDTKILPDLILLDLKMPKLDGKSALQKIRSLAECNSIPIIMVSTSSVESEIRECFDFGANSYITKPLMLEEFTEKIQKLNPVSSGDRIIWG